MTARGYVRLTEAQWDEAAELNSRGATYDDLADRFGTSARTIATHIPAALERRRRAVAASTAGTAATTTVASIAMAALPDVADREAATRHWRQAAWSDAQALQSRLRTPTTDASPDTKAIRAISAAAMALKDLVRLGSDILDVDRHAADEEIPELVVRELTNEEVAEIRRKQRMESGGVGDLDLAELADLEASEDDNAVVTEE